MPTAPILCNFDITFAGNIFKLKKKRPWGMRIILGIVSKWSQNQGCGCGPAPATYFSYKQPLKNAHMITFYTG